MWKITYYNESLKDDVLDLPDTLLAKYARLTEVMKDNGPYLGMPYTKAMGCGLFELRLRGKEGIARVFYCAIVRQEILMLHLIIKKQQETPLRELRLARERLKEAIKNDKNT